MKAAVYYQTGGPEVFRYEEVADPVCAPDGVRIDVKVVSIEGGDTLHRSGGEMAARPHIVALGHEKRALHRMFKLADVARPQMSHEGLHRLV